jgi:hypothetical protein
MGSILGWLTNEFFYFANGFGSSQADRSQGCRQRVFFLGATDIKALAYLDPA